MSARLLFAAFLACHVHATVVCAETEVGDARKAAWQQSLDTKQFHLPPSYSALLRSLSEYNGDAKVHMVFDPKNKWSIEYKFFRDNREILSVLGHAQSAFDAKGNDLYFAKYSPDAAGCTVVAYDLTTGKQRWQTKLHQAQPKGHSGYRNLVSLQITAKGEVADEQDGSAIYIVGRESYCDYSEVLDAKTGETLAVKNYRVGFGAPAGGGGGFGGESKSSGEGEDESRKR